MQPPKCQTCGKPLAGRQRMFCSIPCRNSANGKRTGGWNRQERVTYRCEWCGEPFTRPEGYQRWVAGGKVRHCSLTCHNQHVAAETKSTGRSRGPKNSTWAGGSSPGYYRQFKQESCERCGTTENLLVHHRDHNRKNSDPANLATWCKRCHQLHHGEPRRDPVTGRYT